MLSRFLTEGERRSALARGLTACTVFLLRSVAAWRAAASGSTGCLLRLQFVQLRPSTRLS